MLASLPGWFPSLPEGTDSAALNLGRSLDCHRGRWGRGCDSQGPRIQQNPVQMAHGTVKKGLLSECGQGQGIREGRL